MKPRILFLTTELPWPTDGGGKLRTAETLACLLHFAEVRVLSVSEASDASADARALQRALPGLGVEPPIPHPVRIRRRPLFLVRTAAVQLLRREPYLTAKFASATYQRRARSLVASFAPDLIWCDHLNVFPAARRVAREAGLPLVLDQHNVESDLFVRAAGAGRLAPLARWEGARLRRYEVAALCAADAVVAISGEDAARFAEMSGREAVTILPSMGELGEAPAPPPPSHRVAFLGTLSWPPNAEGVDWLAREVAQRAPELRFVVGGRGLAPAIARRAREAGIELAGWVEDPAAFFRAAGTAVVPLRSGSGIAMKLLDAMRAGVPVVSTPSGARGLPVRHERELLIAEDAHSMAEALRRLAADEDLRRRLVAGAWAYLQAHHARPALASRYREVVESVRRRVQGRR